MLGKCDFNRDPRFYVVKDPTSGGGQGVNSKLAQANNNTFRANNGAYRDRPYGSSGYTYGTGK